MNKMKILKIIEKNTSELPIFTNYLEEKNGDNTTNFIKSVEVGVYSSKKSAITTYYKFPIRIL